MFKKYIFFIFLVSLIFFKSFNLMAAGFFAYVPTKDNQISVIDIAEGKFNKIQLPTDVKNINDVHISPDGKKLFIIFVIGDRAKNNGSICQFDFANNSASMSQPILGKGARSPALTPDGKTIFVLNTLDNTYSKVDTNDVSKVETKNISTSPNSAVISPDGNFLYIAHRFNNDLRKINILTGAEERVEKTHNTNINKLLSEGMAITPDGQKLIIAHRENTGMNQRGGLSFVNTSDLSIDKFVRFDQDGGLLGVTISSDGKTIYSTAANTPNIYSLGINETNFTKFENLTSDKNAIGLEVTPDGKNLVYGVTFDNYIKIYRLDTDFLNDPNGIVNLPMAEPLTSGNFITPIAITSPLTASGKVEVPFEYLLKASSYSPIIELLAEKLPPGLSFDLNTHKITGTPTQDGNFKIQLKAKNKFVQIEETLNLNIAKKDEVVPPNPPANPTPPNNPTPPEQPPSSNNNSQTDLQNADGSKDITGSGGCGLNHEFNSIGLSKLLLYLFSLISLFGKRIYILVKNQ